PRFPVNWSPTKTHCAPVRLARQANAQVHDSEGSEYAFACQANAIQAFRLRRRYPMVIAIDGPAGAGKSTVAREVARECGFTYLDTGAMYRCVGLATLDSGELPARVAERIEIEVGDRVLLDGRDVTEAIRTREVTEA